MSQIYRIPQYQIIIQVNLQVNFMILLGIKYYIGKTKFDVKYVCMTIMLGTKHSIYSDFKNIR